MVVSTFAKVISVTLNSIRIQDVSSKTEIETRITGGGAFELQEGDHALFLGHLTPSGVFHARRYDKREILTPLQEKDLFGVSGQYILTEPLNNPFTAAYLSFLNETYYDSHAKRLVSQRDSAEPDSTTPIPILAPEEGESENVEE